MHTVTRFVSSLPQALHHLGRMILPAPSTTGSKRSFIARLYGYPPPKPTRETAWLDGVRGIAATLVMIYHVNIGWFGLTLEAPYNSIDSLGGIWRLPFLRNFMCSGHAQVSLFFVLSGMVLAWGPLGSIRGGRAEKFAASLSSMAFRRWMRLFLPCFLVALSPMVQVWLGLIEISTAERKGNPLAQLWDYVKACQTFANPFALERSPADAIHYYEWMFWTIPLEWAGSLCVFLVLLAVSRVHNYGRRTLVVGFVAAYACASGRWIYWLFTSGILLADYVQQVGGFEGMQSKSIVHNAAGTVLVVAGLFLMGHPERRDDVWSLAGTPWGPLIVATPEVYMQHEQGIRFWWSWGGLLVLFGACHVGVMRSFFELSFVRWLGQISYMLYLTHGNVNNWVGNGLRPRLLAMLGDRAGDVLPFLLVYILQWVILAPCCFLVAHWAEMVCDAPSIRFARWIDERSVHGFRPEDKGEEEIALTAVT
jgi:peptidoglycan/LPS O-acetylase OafA/YrhL